MKVYTVSELTRTIKNLLENSFPPLWVEGEVTDYRPSSSGHLYFSLKDEYSLIRCIMWRENRTLTTVELRNGRKIRAYGELKIYEKGGIYDLIVERIYPVGIGELQIRFEELKRKLKKEDLFEPEHKKPLPEFPERIGVVTALDGAVLKDIINVIKRRNKDVKIIIRASRVQGEGAAQEIAAAIEEFNTYGKADVLIVGRGGGSIEDLWAFNEEVVARAIYASKIPIISAVGHEIDTTIADFVADCRAATPSAAAEIAVKDSQEILENLKIIKQRMLQNLQKKVAQYKDRLSLLKKSYGIKKPHDLIYQKWQTLDELNYRLGNAFTNPLNQKSTKITFLTQRFNREAAYFFEHYHSKLEVTKTSLEAQIIRLVKERAQRISIIGSTLSGVDPKATLKRGYSICYKLPERTVVKTSKMLLPQNEIEIEFSEGKAKCEVLRTEDH